MIVLLGNGILGGEPQVLLCVQGELEAGTGKGCDGIRHIELPLEHARAVKGVDGPAGLHPVDGGEHQLRRAGAGDLELGGLVHIPKGVAGDGNGGLPVLHHRGQPLHHDGRAEYGAVQDGPDGAVGGLPHLGQPVLLHPLLVGGDGGAFDSHAVFFIRLGGVNGHLVPRLLPVREAQVIILGLEVDIWLQQLLLDLPPEDAGHLVPVHLHQGGFHLQLVHGSSLLLI